MILAGSAQSNAIGGQANVELVNLPTVSLHLRRKAQMRNCGPQAPACPTVISLRIATSFYSWHLLWLLRFPHAGFVSKAKPLHSPARLPATHSTYLSTSSRTNQKQQQQHNRMPKSDVIERAAIYCSSTKFERIFDDFARYCTCFLQTAALDVGRLPHPCIARTQQGARRDVHRRAGRQGRRRRAQARVSRP